MCWRRSWKRVTRRSWSRETSPHCKYVCYTRNKTLLSTIVRNLYFKEGAFFYFGWSVFLCVSYDICECSAHKMEFAQKVKELECIWRYAVVKSMPKMNIWTYVCVCLCVYSYTHTLSQHPTIFMELKVREFSCVCVLRNARAC